MSDLGVRFGVDYDSQPMSAGNAASHREALTALGLREPATPCPWPVLKLFPAGPTLSKQDALVEHTTPILGGNAAAPTLSPTPPQATTPAAPSAPPALPPPPPPVETTVTLVPSTSAPPPRHTRKPGDDEDEPEETGDREEGPGS